MKKKFFGSGKGGGFLQGSKKLTEQVSWHLIYTIFVELFTLDLLKKNQFVYAEIFTLYFFENLIFEKAFFSEDEFDDASPAAFDQSSSSCQTFF